jgi:hypothetical protein
MEVYPALRDYVTLHYGLHLAQKHGDNPSRPFVAWLLRSQESWQKHEQLSLLSEAELFQLHIFSFCLFEDGDVLVGIFP